MSIIHQLDPHTINLINAGEVVESTSSVVKELIENGLDSGASEIVVEIIAGGRQRIRVSDNGSGMGFEDAKKCLLPHATSKIRALDDLNLLSTMGFRGEALASIAAVSKMVILTALKEGSGRAEGATLVECDAGEVQLHTKAVRDQGTTIEINDLFYNVPVRKKFLRSPTFDNQEIEKVFLNYTLAYPHVKFHLICDQKTVLRASRSLCEDESLHKVRIDQVLGGNFIQEALHFKGSIDNVDLKGWILNPTIHRPNRTGQYIFINQRPIQSLPLSMAVKEGFGPTLDEKRHPLFVLYLTIPSSEVDVNVHPQKSEVRLKNRGLITNLITKSVKEALIPKALTSPIVESFVWNEPPPIAPFQMKQEPKYIPLELDLVLPHVVSTLNGYILFEAASAPGLFKEPPSEGIALLELAGAYIYLLDLEEEEKPLIARDALLIPETIELTRSETTIVEGLLPYFNQLGIEMSLFGQSTFLLESVPLGFKKQDVLNHIHEVLQDAAKWRGKEEAKKRTAALSLSKRKMSCQEAAYFIKRLLKRLNTKQEYSWIEYLGTKEIERLFKRKREHGTIYP